MGKEEESKAEIFPSLSSRTGEVEVGVGAGDEAIDDNVDIANDCNYETTKD